MSPFCIVFRYNIPLPIALNLELDGNSALAALERATIFIEKRGKI